MNKVVLIVILILLIIIKINKSKDNFTNYNDFEYSDKLSVEDIKELKKGQQKMTNMLRVFDRICRKHNIKYWCLGGTLIGAIRHNGWIPFDGDIDIGVLIDDCNILKNALKNELPSDMWYQDNDTDKNYKSNILKIRDLNSCYLEHSDNKSIAWHNGLQLDIFTFSKTNNKIHGLHPVCGSPDKNERDLDDIFPLKETLFENIIVYIPNKYKKICKELWDGYPPKMIVKEKRFPHEGKINANKTCNFHYNKYPNLHKH